MSRVLTTAVVGSGARMLTAASPDELDPVVRVLVERADASGYARGLEDGHVRGIAAARAETARHTETLTERVVAAVAEAAQAAQDRRDGAVEATVELAVAIAETILGREPHDGGTALAGRLRETLLRLEDPTPVVHVSPEDAELVGAALADVRGLTVTPDATLTPGDARIQGGWAQADLTQATALAAIRRELGVDH